MPPSSPQHNDMLMDGLSGELKTYYADELALTEDGRPAAEEGIPAVPPVAGTPAVFSSVESFSGMPPNQTASFIKHGIHSPQSAAPTSCVISIRWRRGSSVLKTCCKATQSLPQWYTTLKKAAGASKRLEEGARKGDNPAATGGGGGPGQGPCARGG
jgi:hypothetical protein